MYTTPPPEGMRHLLDTMQHLSAANRAMLDHLMSVNRAMTIAEIAESQGLHQNSVRESLEALYEVGLVGRRAVKVGGRGRPAWRYFSIAPNIHAISGVYISKFTRTVSEMLRMRSSDAQAAAFSVGTYWAGALDPIITEVLRKKILEGVNYRDLSDYEKIALIRGLLSSVGHAASLKEGDFNTLCIKTCPFLDMDGTVDPLVCEIHRGQIAEIVKRISENTEEGILHPRVRAGICELTIRKLDQDGQ